jgi:hypothetical protein
MWGGIGEGTGVEVREGEVVVLKGVAFKGHGGPERQ